MANYRDPKVTTTEKSGMSRWIWIALAVVVVLLLLFWFFGASDTADTTVPAETAPATTTEPAAPATQ